MASTAPSAVSVDIKPAETRQRRQNIHRTRGSPAGAPTKVTKEAPGPVSGPAVPTPAQKPVPPPGEPEPSDRSAARKQQPTFGNEPVVLLCPQCFRHVKTNVELENGRFAKAAAVLLCLSVCCCCCFWLPLNMNYFKDLYHVCPNCRGILHERKVIE